MTATGTSVADVRLAGARRLRDYLPWALGYPLGSHALAVAAMIAVFVTLGSRSLVGIPLLAITAIWTLHYLLQIIEQTTQGRATPPPLSAEVVYLDGWRTARALIGPALAMTVAAALEGRAHGAALRLWWTLVLFAAPAYLFILAFEADFLKALNPLRWAQLAWAMGVAYAVPCAALSGVPAVLAYLIPRVPIGLAAAGVFLSMALAAHLIGVIAVLQRDRIGLSTHLRRPEQQVAEQALDERLSLLLLRLDAHLRAQDVDGAIAALSVEWPAPQRRAFYEALLQRLLLRGQTALIPATGRYLIAALIEARQPARALEVFESCDAIAGSGWLPDTPAQVRVLAEQAIRERLDETLARLVSRAQQRWPDDAAVISLRLLLARDLCERRGEDAAAREVVRTLLPHDAHPEYAQIAALARQLDRH